MTETRGAGYPLNFIENAVLPSVGEHPKNIFFLTADAFGVLPRLPDSMRNKPCITSCPATHRKSLAPKAASEKNPSRHFQAASVHPFCRSRQAPTQKCSDADFEVIGAHD